jgi:uncharacterized membrane protein
MKELGSMTLFLSRSTKNCHVYGTASGQPEGLIRNLPLYLEKKDIGDIPPSVILITVANPEE